ncbi:MAG: 50S ribosomal protein L13 [Halobacteriota archaeon]
MTIIDATGLIVGRLASTVAHRLLSGEEINIINAEKAIVSGSQEASLSKYQVMRSKGSKERGPYYPKRADMILRRTIRGMLPYKKARGRAALANLRVYMGVPIQFSGAEAETLEHAHKSRLSTIKMIELRSIAQQLGAKERGNIDG